MPSLQDLWDGFLPHDAIIMSRPVAPSDQPRPRIYFERSETLNAETEALFHKMTGAMGLSPEAAPHGPALETPAEFTIRLTGGAGLGKIKPGSLTTHSLSEMLTRPELKRETWNHLKSAALALGLKIK